MDKKLIKCVVVIGLIVLAVILLVSYLNKSNVFSPKYEVTTRLYNGAVPSISVGVTGPAANIVVALISPEKRSTTMTIDKTDMMATGSKSVYICFSHVGSTDGNYTVTAINKDNGKKLCQDKTVDVFFDRGGNVFEKRRISERNNGGITSEPVESSGE
jgi:uncharacterized protein (UPF0333 family)